jgi:diguanylate cyclase (GGDEF)-like protein/PAS domain S-box-containing protein
LSKVPKHIESIRELRRWRTALEAAGDLAYEWDLATGMVRWIGDPSGFFGSEAEAPRSGEDLNRRLHPEDIERRMRRLGDHIAGLADYDCDFRLRGADGEYVWVQDRGSMRISPSGTPLAFAAALRKISGHKQREAELERRAARDELTGLDNLAGFKAELAEAIHDAARLERSGACIVFGVDGLQMINRAFGYAAGQHALVQTSACIAERAPEGVFLARLGDDRFGAILSGTSSEAAAFAEDVLSNLRSATPRYQGEPLHFTLSAGIMVFPAEGQGAIDILGAAEAALSDAKSAGRDRALFFDAASTHGEVCKASMETGAQIRLALEEDRLRLAYQPIVEAGSGEIRYHEGLLRMVLPDGRVAAAGEFITVAERVGLIRAIDRGVMELAVAELIAYPEVRLSINLSGLTATDGAWLDALSRELRDRRDVAERLIVEITETAAMHDLTQIAEMVDAVRALGCKVALDDFGAGFTTFRHLRSLTIDIVKIDRSFVSGAWRSEESRVFLQTLLGLAKTFGMEVVAEGVEDAEDEEFLIAEGFDCLQGWHIGRPQLEPAWRLAPQDQPVKPSEVVETVGGGYGA